LTAVVTVILVAGNRGLAADRAAIPGAIRALVGERAGLSRAQRRTIVGHRGAAVTPTPIVAVTDGVTNFATRETHIAVVNNGAGISAALAAFHIVRRANADIHAGFAAGVSEVHIGQRCAIRQSNCQLVVVSGSIAALVAAGLATSVTPVVFVAIATIAVFPMAIVALIPPAFGALA